MHVSLYFSYIFQHPNLQSGYSNVALDVYKYCEHDLCTVRQSNLNTLINDCLKIMFY